MKIAVQGLPGLQTLARQVRDTALPNGALSKAVEYAAKSFALGTALRAHRKTGTMEEAQTYEINGLYARVYTGDKHNPETGQLASLYAPYEEARGGAHAFYDTTFTRTAESVAAGALLLIEGELP